MRKRIPRSTSLTDREWSRLGWLAKKAKVTRSILSGKLIDIAYESERRKEARRQ